MTTPETDDETQKRSLKELEGKNIAYYSVSLQAWIATKMERDRTLVTLSAAGVGLLTTILNTAGIRYSFEIALYGFAFVGFFTTIFTCLTIYEKNSDYIEDQIKGNGASKGLLLKKFDQWSKIAFAIGVGFAMSIGLAAETCQIFDTCKSFTIRRLTVADNEKAISKPSFTKSLEGLSNLRPETSTPPVPIQPEPSSPQGNSDHSGVQTSPPE